MGGMLQELLSGIIDYAGLFPPARLEMAEAVAEYNHLRSGSEAWIVDKFLCPAPRLAELAEAMDEPFEVGVIGTGGADLDAFETGLEADAKAMTAFAEVGDLVSYEVRQPGGDLKRVISDLKAFEQVEVYLELPWGPAQLESLAAVAESDWLGAKARTGGTETGAFPSADSLAAFLKTAQDLAVPFKLTAGLHHPLPFCDDGLKVRHHGFLNVLAALALNEAHDLSRAEMAEVLEEERLDWDQDGIRWKGLESRAAGDVRDLFVGFGSCSVAEPLEGLAALRLIEGVRN